MRTLITPCAIVLALLTHPLARAGGPDDLEAHKPHFLARLAARGRLQSGRTRLVPLVEPALLSAIVRARRLLPQANAQRLPPVQPGS